ncbi:hypothetical protein AMJ86_09615 [bacterium SM23_57]|jgi:hypothetical protein|nr:MAG: hypothetical protein AMJ86_09615 [bacterium SM23_57]
MLVFNALIGFSILILGRQLFWVTIAGLGFVLGMNYATQFFQGTPETILMISLAAGIVGAILGYALQRAAAGLVGFLAGWYLTTMLLNTINLNIGQYSIFLTILGGLIGIGLISLLFDWSLILLSTLAGSAIITQSIPFTPQTQIAIFIILFVLGFIIQAILFINEKSDFKS